MRVHFCLFILSQWGAHWLAQLMILSFSIKLFDSSACHGSVRSMPVAFCDIPIILSGLFSFFFKPKRTCSNELMQILSPVGDFYHILRLLNHLSDDQTSISNLKTGFRTHERNSVVIIRLFYFQYSRLVIYQTYLFIFG